MIDICGTVHWRWVLKWRVGDAGVTDNARSGITVVEDRACMVSFYFTFSIYLLKDSTQ